MVKLKKNEYIISQTEVKNNRTKKLYYITDSGRVQFGKLMRQDWGPDKYRSNQLLKMLFFYELTGEERLQSISNQIQYFKTMEKDLQNIRDTGKLRLEAMRLSLDSCKPAQYENDALEFGLAYSGFVIDWFEAYYKKLRRRHEDNCF